MARSERQKRKREGTAEMIRERATTQHAEPLLHDLFALRVEAISLLIWIFLDLTLRENLVFGHPGLD